MERLTEPCHAAMLLGQGTRARNTATTQSAQRPGVWQQDIERLAGRFWLGRSPGVTSCRSSQYALCFSSTTDLARPALCPDSLPESAGLVLSGAVVAWWAAGKVLPSPPQLHQQGSDLLTALSFSKLINWDTKRSQPHPPFLLIWQGESSSD